MKTATIDLRFASLLCAAAIAAGALIGCGSSDDSTGGDTSTDSSASTGGGGGAGGSDSTLVKDVRGDRYCEILVGKLSGGSVHVNVYNTYGLNDCPQDQWDTVDADAIKAQEKADSVVLNGPRYWMIDAFLNSSLLDDTVKTFAGIEMRLAGSIDLTFADVQAGSVPYAARTISRNTTYVFEANKLVYELVDPDGKIYDMQSFSVQNTQQTQDSLAGLDKQLKLPAGWQFRTRTLTEDLQVVAVDGKATVIQDDFDNTYQLSQQ
jgi:hypothetical protein